MFKINEISLIKIILFCAYVNTFLFIAFHPSGLFRLIIAGCLNLSALLLIFLFFLSYKKRFKNINYYYKIIFFLIIIWSFFIVFRSFQFDGKVLITLFGHYLMAWAWVTFFAVSIGISIFNWLYLLNFFKIILLFAVLLTFGIFFFQINYAFGLLKFFFVVFFLLFLYRFHNSKLLILLGLIIYILLSIYVSKRANYIFIFLMIFMFIIEYFRSKEISILKKIFLTLFILFIILILFLYIGELMHYILHNRQLTTDTRSFLFLELFNDLSIKEQIIGRGALGKYFSEYFYILWTHGLGGDYFYRTVVESGYLQMILKGGYIIIILYLLILIPAFFIGIFKSKNIIGRMCGYYILIFLLLWFVSYYPIYSPEFIFLWMCVGTVINKRNLEYTNEEILKIFKREKNEK